VKVVTTTRQADESKFQFDVVRRPSAHRLLELVRWSEVVFHNYISLRTWWPLLLSDGDSTLALVALRSGHTDFKTLQFLEEKKSKLDSEQIRVVLKAEARQAAAEKNFQQAYDLARQALRNIPFPNRQQLSEQECRVALMKNPEDMSAAFDLCMVLGAEKRRDEAVSILDDLCRHRDCPDYLQLMKAEFLASLTDWPAAWNEISGLL
jgi:hypothetical protein